MRLINTFNNSISDTTARIYYSEELEEFQVKFFTERQHRPTMDYFTDDRHDAISTAQQVLFDLALEA
jgi:hypothetical protein